MEEENCRGGVGRTKRYEVPLFFPASECRISEEEIGGEGVGDRGGRGGEGRERGEKDEEEEGKGREMWGGREERITSRPMDRDTMITCRIILYSAGCVSYQVCKTQKVDKKRPTAAQLDLNPQPYNLTPTNTQV